MFQRVKWFRRQRAKVIAVVTVDSVPDNYAAFTLVDIYKFQSMKKTKEIHYHQTLAKVYIDLYIFIFNQKIII